MYASFLLCVLSAGLFAYTISRKNSRDQKLYKCFSGPRILPVVGNILHFVKALDFRSLTAVHAKYGNRILVTCGSVKLLLLAHPNDLEKILGSKEHINKPSFYNMLLSGWLGESMFYAKGQEYFTMRKMLLPAFSSKIVKMSTFGINQHAHAFVNILKRNEANGATTEIYWLLTLCALDITFEVYGFNNDRYSLALTELTVGKSIGCLKNPHHEYAVAIHNETKYFSERGLSPWLWPELLWNLSPLGRKEKANRTLMQTHMHKIVNTRKIEVDAIWSAGEDCVEEKDQLNFIDLLIHEQRQGKFAITDKYIRDECNAMIFAGHDTVASSITWTVYLLATNPEEQAKLHLELDQVFGNDRNKHLEVLELNKLKFLDCCIKEALRVYPPSPAYFRAIEKDVQLDKDTTIPAGFIVMISPWITHRLPEFYPEPEKFMPSRFLRENATQKHPFAFIPFSAGPRNCIGQKVTPAVMKIILAHLFHNFTVELASPEKDVTPALNGIIFPPNGLRVKLKSRET